MERGETLAAVILQIPVTTVNPLLDQVARSLLWPRIALVLRGTTWMAVTSRADERRGVSLTLVIRLGLSCRTGSCAASRKRNDLLLRGCNIPSDTGVPRDVETPVLYSRHRRSYGVLVSSVFGVMGRSNL